MFLKQNSKHDNHFEVSTSDAKHSTNHDNPSHPIQNRFNYCPTLSPLKNIHNYFGSPKIHALVDSYNHHEYLQSHFVNESINCSSHHQAEQSYQIESNKQPPKQSFVGRKPNINKAEKATTMNGLHHVEIYLHQNR